MIKKYQKKPVVIEAVQYTGTQESQDEVSSFCKGNIILPHPDTISKDISIITLEGCMTASVGDFIIKGVKGEFYPCKPDIFEQTYQEVTPDVDA